jgi:hypothetical protein
MPSCALSLYTRDLLSSPSTFYFSLKGRRSRSKQLSLSLFLSLHLFFMLIEKIAELWWATELGVNIVPRCYSLLVGRRLQFSLGRNRGLIGHLFVRATRILVSLTELWCSLAFCGVVCSVFLCAVIYRETHVYKQLT